MGEILFLTHRVPWPPNRGDKIRSHHILRKLIECAPVHLACFADDQEEAEEQSDIQDGLASCKTVVRTKSKWAAGLEAIAFAKPVSLTSFHSVDIERYVHATIEHRPIDCIFVFSGQMAQYIPKDFRGRIVMDFADVDSAKFETYGAQGSGPMAWINRREGYLLKAFEKRIADRADYSLFVSKAEASLFHERSGVETEKIVAVGNGIDLDFYDPAKIVTVPEITDGPLIIFTGQMDYRPNVEAVESFAKEVMPTILQGHPQARFAIVGRAPTDDVKKLADKQGVIVTGAVDDIRSWLNAADIVVAPLRIARGIQNKVLEAMAMGKAVIASNCAAEGIDAVHEEHFLVADDVAAEGEMVCSLLDAPEEVAKLGNNARLLIRSSYSWDEQLSVLPALCGLDSHALAEAAE